MGEVRPKVEKPTVYGGLTSETQWHEYPSGLIDLSRPSVGISTNPEGPQLAEGSGLLELGVDGERRVRVRAEGAAVVVVDMQNFFLMPELRTHTQGLALVDPILKVVRHLRPLGVKIIYLNWGLDASSPLTAALDRDFRSTASAGDLSTGGPEAGFGADLGRGLGRLLYRGEKNARMWGPLQEEWEGHRAEGDLWVDKDRMSGLWGRGSELERVLEEDGRKTLFVVGINADQCVSSTIVDAFSLGYDVIAVSDCIATTSPGGAKEQLLFNMLHEYGFVTDSERVVGTKLA